MGKFALYEVSRPAQCDNVAPKAFSHLPNTRIAKTTVLNKIGNDISILLDSRLDICRDPGTGGPVKIFLTV